MHILVVDLLAERQGFGRAGVEEITSYFDQPRISLWSPHTSQRVDYGFGTVVDSPVEADLIVITGSNHNVSMWEAWMDEVAQLIRETQSPMIGICFGHQIIAAALGGKVIRAEHPSSFVGDVQYTDGQTARALFTHQDHVIDAGEMEIIGSAEHCPIAVCRHANRPILSVQYHPEAVARVLEQALHFGEMSPDERQQYQMDDSLINTADALLRPIGIVD